MSCASRRHLRRDQIRAWYEHRKKVSPATALGFVSPGWPVFRNP
jgi:hypothetical protein